MSNPEVTCSAERSRQDIRARKNTATQNSPSITAQHQYIGGVIVPTPVAGQTFPVIDPARSQIVPKSSLSVPTPIGAPSAPKVSFPQVISPNNSTSQTGGVGSMSGTAANMTEGETSTQKMRMSQSGVLYTLNMIREPVVEYQESRGIPRNEEITFVTLVTSLCTQAYTAAITILVMLWNLMPLVDGLVYFVRFFLDKLIDIVQTPDNKEKAIKGAIFFGELTVVTFIIFMIVGLIFMPVYVLMARLFGKVFSMIAW